MNTDSVTFARGDSGRLIDVLVFLAESSAHSLTVRPLSSAPADTAQAIRKAVSEDGYDADSKLKDVLVLHMVFGRVERDIIVAHLSTEVKGSPSSIDYVVEGPVLLGRSYGNYKPDVVFSITKFVLRRQIRFFWWVTQSILVTGIQISRCRSSSLAPGEAPITGSFACPFDKAKRRNSSS